MKIMIINLALIAFIVACVISLANSAVDNVRHHSARWEAQSLACTVVQATPRRDCMKFAPKR
jgi:hypothetical protein